MTNPVTNDNQQPVIIFFDLDGVLSDFDRWAVEQGKLKADGSVNWPAIDENWWATMPACPGAKDAYDKARTMGFVKFLTAGDLDPGSLSGKAKWVQKFVPERGKFIMRDMITAAAANKYLLARFDRVLIDDNQKNINDWVAAGGIGIHHTGDWAVTLKALADAITKLGAPEPVYTPPVKNKFNKAPGM